MELPGRQNPLVQAVAPGMQLSRELGAQGLEPQGSWGSWLVGDRELRGKLQGGGGRPQRWDHRMEELPGGLESALYLSPECPHLGWSHRAPLVYPHSHRSLWPLALDPEVSSSHEHLAPSYSFCHSLGNLWQRDWLQSSAV